MEDPVEVPPDLFLFSPKNMGLLALGNK